MESRRLTQEYIRKLFIYNYETGTLKWKVRLSNRHKEGDEAGHVGVRGYSVVGINKKTYCSHRLIWLYEYGYLPENEIDHKNRNKIDNRLSNLRELSHRCNSLNTYNFKHNQSGVKGVHWCRGRKKWEAQICINGKSIGIGRYKEFDNAVCARLAAEQCLGWTDCNINSPSSDYVKKMLCMDQAPKYHQGKDKEPQGSNM